MTVKVFANDTTGDATEASADTKPLFQATFTPLRYLPAIPMSTKWLGYLGVDSRLAQPPLPEGKGSQGELPGTDKWCSILPVMSSSRTSFGWFDVSQPGEVTACTQEHFWPGLKQWHIGSVMENADIDFGEGTFWDPPKSAL